MEVLEPRVVLNFDIGGAGSLVTITSNGSGVIDEGIIVYVDPIDGHLKTADAPGFAPSIGNLDLGPANAITILKIDMGGATDPFGSNLVQLGNFLLGAKIGRAHV